MAHIVKTPCDEGVIQAARQTSKLYQPLTRPSGTWVLVATILGSSMAFIDGTVVNVALPVLQTELKATVADVQWVVEAYALFLSALILVGGSLGDHYGRRRIYATGIILFTLASVVCGFAPNVTVLIAARAIQGVGGVVYGLIEANNLGLGDPQVILALVVGVASLVAFLIVEARSPNPMVPLSLFRSRPFSGANLLTLMLYAALGGALFFLPFNLIRVQGYSPTAAGAANLPFILIMFFLSRWSGGLVARYGAKLPLIVGPIIAAIGFVLFALPDIGGSYWTTFFPAVVVLGIGMAISVAPLTTAVMGAVSAQRAGIASGINNAVARTAGLLAVAVLGIVALLVFSTSLGNQLAALPIPTEVRNMLLAQQSKLVGIVIPPGLSSTTQAAVQRAIDESFVSSFRVIMLIAAGLALVSALSSFLLIEGKQVRGETKAPQSSSLSSPAEVSKEGA